MGRQKLIHLNTTKQGEEFLSAVVENAEYNEIVIQHLASGEGETALWTLEKINGKKVPVKFPSEEGVQNIVNLETERAMSAETMLAEAIEGIEIVQLDESELTSNEQAAYVLHVDNEQKGARISIPKDNALYSVYVGHIDDSLVSPYDPTVVDGTGDTALCFIYQLSDNEYKLVAVNIEDFLDENEFSDGLTVNNHVVKVLIDPTSESYLTVSENGVKLEGIDNEFERFDTKIDEEIDRAMSAETALQENIDAEQERAEATEQLLQDNIIVLDNKLDEEIDRAISAETEIQTNIDIIDTKIDEEIERATDAETVLRQDIDEESDRAMSAETVLQEEVDSIEIVQLDDLAINDRAAYALHINGEQKGVRISIPKDESLYSVYVGHVDDTIVSPSDPTVVDGTGDTALCFIYQLSDGKYTIVTVNISEFLDENEFSDGLTVDNHVVKVLIDPDSDQYLTVSTNGIKLEGIESEFDNINEKLDDEIDIATSAETAIQTNLDAEVERAQEAEQTLDSKIDNEIERATDTETVLRQDIDELEEKIDNIHIHPAADVEVGQPSVLHMQVEGDIDSQRFTIMPKLGKIEEATEWSVGLVPSGKTGLVDAWDAKQYIGRQISQVESDMIEYVNQEMEYVISAETELQEEIDSIEIVKLDDSELTSNEQAAYALHIDGATKGARISIPKDNSLYRTYLGHVDDSLTSSTDPTVVDGTGDTALCFIYQLSDNTYELVAVNVSQFLEEAEFADGLTVDNHVVKVLIDPTSESYLTVSSDGVKLEGIDDELNTLDAKIDDEIERAISAETAIQTNVDALEQMVYEVSDNLNAEINRATNAEQSIQDNVVILTQTIEDVSESVANESTRATEAEQLIQTNVDALEQMVYEVSDNLNAEIDRATSAETTIQTNLNSEVERATSAETVLRESIDSIEIVKIDNPSELSTNEREAYLLKVDNATKGARISIYKDSSLYRTYLGHVDDSLVSEDSPAVNYGGGDEALCFIYYTMEGKYQLVTINVETFLSENEFLDGLTVFQGHSIKVKIDPTSEKYNGFDLLTVSTEGVKLNGVQNIVSAMVQTVDVKVEIGANSYDYLESTQVTPPNKYFKIDAKTIDIEDADSNNTGLLDAYNVKNYIDNLIIDCGTY